MRDETKMDASRLISEVYKRPALWNQRHTSYHNRDIADRIWTEMETLFKLPKQILKTKWKGLRDTFRAEIKKDKVYRKSNYTPNRPVWTHFETLQFLKEQMLPRPPIWERNDNNKRVSDAPMASTTEHVNNSNNRIPTTTTATRDNNRRVSKRLCSQQQNSRIEKSRNRDSSIAPRINDDDRDVEITVQENILKDDNRSTDVCTLNKSRNRHPNRNNHQHRNINKNNRINNDNSNESQENTVKLEPIENCEKNLEEFINLPNGYNNDNEISSQEVLMAIDETSATPEMNNYIGMGQITNIPDNNRFDDNYYFFMSLLPHIRTLPADRCMLLRMQMQQLVYQEVYNRTTTRLSSTSLTLPTT